ncbi:MAG: glycerol-3-phosphate 1-O-acyltransferase PlsY [Anaerolineaceae bacterium]|nr:glycerol-3-phosphate 1-O-acyltransferase PlsY [Anaerolineaceae bacterium]
MNIPLVVIALLLGYALGNFSPAYLLGRWIGGFDIREQGSGNAGATNVMRTLGWRYGVLVFTLDIIKGAAAAALGFWLAGNFGLAAAGVGVVLGHDYPAALGFRGGKGIAATTGVLLSLIPIPTLVGILVFVLIILGTRMVSVASLTFVSGMAVYTILTNQPLYLIALAVIAAIFAIVRHKDNIRRVLAGVENKISFQKKT